MTSRVSAAVLAVGVLLAAGGGVPGRDGEAPFDGVWRTSLGTVTLKQTGETVTILKRGRPVARLVPPALGQSEYPQRALFGTVEILGDVVEPVLPAAEWEAESGPDR